MSEDVSAEDSGQALPNWLNPSSVPPWLYLLIILGGGGTVGGMELFGDDSHDVSMEDLARIEAKADKIDEKVDELNDKFTELRVAIARFHAADAANP